MHHNPLSSEECINARMIAEPLCLYDFCQETDGAGAVITTGHAHGRVRYWERACRTNTSLLRATDPSPIDCTNGRASPLPTSR